jgi:hypothetical protein
MGRVRDGIQTIFIENIGKNILSIKMDVNFIFSVGYRCTTDDFLKKYNLRTMSSPFSYMVIDLNTSLNFIHNEFKEFIDVNYIDNIKLKKYKWKDELWNHELFFNKDIKLLEPNKPIIDYDKICVWNHHNLNDENTKQTIQKRCDRMMYYLKNHQNNVLLFYIDKLRKPILNNLDYVDFDIINTITSKYKVRFLYLLPIENHPKIEIIQKEYINIIIYPSNNNSNSNDIKDNFIPWDKVFQIISSFYDFEVDV